MNSSAHLTVPVAQCHLTLNVCYNSDDYLQCDNDNNNVIINSVMGVQVENEQSLNYGCMGINDNTHEVVHYIEKPSSFVSNHINAGVYLLSVSVYDDISAIFQERVGTGTV